MPLILLLLIVGGVAWFLAERGRRAREREAIARGEPIPKRVGMASAIPQILYFVGGLGILVGILGLAEIGQLNSGAALMAAIPLGALALNGLLIVAVGRMVALLERIDRNSEATAIALEAVTSRVRPPT